MAISLKHAFQSAKSDGPDATRVQPSNWNAEHTMTMATGKVLGRATAGTGAVEELDAGAFGRTLLALTSADNASFSHGYFSKRFKLTGIAEAAITANQNDYDIGDNSIVGFTADAARTITGFNGGAAGRFLTIENRDTTDTITLANESASSAAANRMMLGADFALLPGTAISLFYDGTSSRWRPIGTYHLFASQAQAEAGTDTATMASPLRVAQGARIFGAALPGASGLKVEATSATQVQITAAYLVAVDSSGRAYRKSSLSVTAAITSSGANGLDTGTEASGTWYYAYAIYNPSTDTWAALLSTSATSPTLPSGYTAFYRCGAVRNDGSSNFLRAVQYRGVLQLQSTIVMANGSAGIWNSMSPTWSSLAVSSYVPPTASTILLYAGVRYNNTGPSAILAAPNNSYGGPRSTSLLSLISMNSDEFDTIMTFDMILEGSNIYWVSSGNGGWIGVRGWIDNI